MALDSHGKFHLHTRRSLAQRLGHDDAVAGAIDLWTACIANGMPCADWRKMMRDTGFVDLPIGPAVDALGGAGGEVNARRFEVFG